MAIDNVTTLSRFRLSRFHRYTCTLLQLSRRICKQVFKL